MTFKKTACLTDLHLGKKNSSDIHNRDCVEFIHWFITESKKFGAESCFILGDWHDTRNNLNIKTLNYSVDLLDLLSKNFEQVVIIVGNHDSLTKSDLSTHSLVFGNHINNVRVIDSITIMDDCAFVPWITNDAEMVQVRNLKTKYMFAHLELPSFYTNAKVTMQDHGKLNSEDFSGPEYIFSGHFHIRQTYKNHNSSTVIYMGNCFPHNYGDANDIDRGCMLLEHSKEPIFVNWGDCPKYFTCSLSELLENPESYLSSKSHVKVDCDINIDYNDISYIREVLFTQFNCRELVILPKKSDLLIQEIEDVTTEFKTVDTIVLNHIESLETVAFDKQLLAGIYNSI